MTYLILSFILVLVFVIYLSLPYCRPSEDYERMNKGVHYVSSSRDTLLQELQMELETNKISPSQFKSEKETLLKTKLED